MIDESHLAERGGIPVKMFPMEGSPDYANTVLPELDYLELWLGAEDRERTCAIDDVRTFRDTNPFPKLTAMVMTRSISTFRFPGKNRS